MKKSILFIAFSMLLAVVSCKDGKKENATPKAHKVKKEVVKETKKEVASEIHLELTGNDAMMFDKAELRVKEGQKVILTFKHIGKMAKNVMGHNVVLLKQGTDLPSFAEKAIAAKDNNYIPKGDLVLAHTKLIGGGESTTITFVAPAKGTYDFICSFPGHYGMMKGKFIVE